MKKLVSDTFRCAVGKIDPDRLHNTFELFGYDFMIDEQFRIHLIEVNTNPCLNCDCPLLSRIIPELLDNTFRVALDPLFPSPDMSQNRKFQLNELPQEVKFTLCFYEDVEGDELSEGDSDLEELQRPVKVTDKFQKAMEEESYSNSFDEQEEKPVVQERKDKESDYSEDFD